MAEKQYADKRYYTNRDRTKLVAEGSEDAAYLVVGEGGEITDEMRERYGSGLKGEAREEPAEEPGIVVSGTRDGGPSFVRADATAEADEGTAEAPARTTSKAPRTAAKGAKR